MNGDRLRNQPVFTLLDCRRARLSLDIIKGHRVFLDTGRMNKITTNQTLELEGKINRWFGWKVGWAVAFERLGYFLAYLSFGIFLWLQAADEGDVRMYMYWVYAVIFFIIAAFIPFNEYTYLDFADRQIVTLKDYCGFEISKRCRPLTDFNNIVVRHLCRPGNEGEATYTGSVGLKPVDGRAVLWVKSFRTTQDGVPRTAYEFARKLQEMMGLPGALMGEFKSAAAEPIACVSCGTTIPGDANREADLLPPRLWRDIIRDMSTEHFNGGDAYLDFTDRRIVTPKHYGWFEKSKRSRPLSDFSNIVVRHLCHTGGEGGDTYTSSVGLKPKPADGGAVLWVKHIAATQDEVPRAAYEFARKLREITGLPGEWE